MSPIGKIGCLLHRSGPGRPELALWSQTLEREEEMVSAPEAEAHAGEPEHPALVDGLDLVVEEPAHEAREPGRP